MQRVVAGLFFMSVTAGIAQAQFSDEGLKSSGNSTIERPSEQMRMQIDLMARSRKDLADALLRLKSRRAKAEKVLETLGVKKGSVKIGDPEIDLSADMMRAQGNIMIQGAAIAMPVPVAGGHRKKPEEPAKPIKVKARLTADWTLQPGDATAQLVESRKLMESIKQADLSGLKEIEQAIQSETPDAGEVQPPENVAFGMVGWGGQQPVAGPGEPNFAFTAQISAADYDKAVSEAFRKSREEAVRLAKATEIQMGPLKSLRVSKSPEVTSAGDDFPQTTPWNGRQNRINCVPDLADGYCATGTRPGLLEFMVIVETTYAIK